MWYVIQTMTGQEAEVLLFMNTILDAELYEECFVIKAEWMKRLGGKWQLQVRPLFPGYVFTRTDRSEELFLRLKDVPKFSKLLGTGRYEFVPVRDEEEQFLKRILNGNRDYTVKLTTVAASEDGKILAIDGVLELFEKNVLRWNLHKRYAVVRVEMLGEEKSVIFGIRLLKDEMTDEMTDKLKKKLLNTLIENDGK